MDLEIAKPAQHGRIDANLPSKEWRQPLPDLDDSPDIRDYLEVVLRHKWLVSIFLIASFVTTLFVSLAMKPVYRSEGRLELSMQAPKVTKFQGLVTSEIPFMQTREFMMTQMKLLKSESLAHRVIEKLHLEKNPAFNPKQSSDSKPEDGMVARWKKNIKSWLGWETVKDPDIARMAVQQMILDKFVQALTVQTEVDTTLLSLAFNSTDAALSRDVINTIIAEFISWQMDKRIDATSSAKQQLEKQLEIARSRLEKSESDLNLFAQKKGIVSLDSNMNLVYRELEEVNRSLASVETERIVKEALYLQAKNTNIDSNPNVLSNTLIQSLRQEYVKTIGEYQQQYEIFKDEFPQVKALKARVSDLEKKITDQEARILSSLKNDYSAAIMKEEALRKDADNKKILALELNNQATQYKILEREVDTNKAIFQSLLERSKEIDANVGTDIGNIQVVDYARMPIKPYKPNIRLNLLVSIMVGLMGGIGMAFFLEYMDNTIKRIDEIQNRFRIPLLGVIPYASPDEVKSLDFLVRLKPRASFSESIRTAMVSTQLSSAIGRPPKSLLITSTSAGEGKSTIACNLAQAFANSEERILLIDADLRKPRLHKVFGLYGSGNGSNLKRMGLSQLLSGIHSVEEVIVETKVPHLYVIPAGPIPPNPAELLASNRTREVLDDLGQKFDRIIIDAPPAVGFADVLVLGNYVDSVILVANLGQTHREALRLFRRSLLSVRAHLLGAIINKLDISNQYGGYYYKYYKYYHYYYHPASYGDKTESIPEIAEDISKHHDEQPVQKLQS